MSLADAGWDALEQRDVVAGFGGALVFWQPGLASSLDDPLEFPAEGWIVGSS